LFFVVLSGASANKYKQECYIHSKAERKGEDGKVTAARRRFESEDERTKNGARRNPTRKSASRVSSAFASLSTIPMMNTINVIVILIT
jgi:hypothetical protein